MTKKDIETFIIIFLFTLIIFIGFVTMHYATDTYNIINRGYKEYAIKYSLNDGRPMMSIISLIANLLNIPISIYIILLTCLAIFVSCISVLILKKIIVKYKQPINNRSEIILTIICYSTIFNFMFLESMQFAECFVMSISILVYLIAANILVDKEKNYIFKALLLSIIGIFFYQGTISFFIVMTMLFSLIKTDIKTGIKNIVIACICCIIAVIVNLIQIKISGTLLNINQVRMGSISNIIHMIPIIIRAIIITLIQTCNLFPSYLFMSFIIVILSIKKNEKNINTYMIILILLSIAGSFAPNLFTTAALGTGRMLFSVGAIIGNMYIILYAKTEIFQNNNITRKIFEIIIIVYLIITTVNFTYIIYCHKNVEKLNKKECSIINQYMIEYESNNNIKLKNIAICYDSKPTFYYNEINNFSSLCLRPLSLEWSDDGSINYYTKRKLKEIGMPLEIYDKYFKDKNWNNLSREQFIFIEDTVYYCIY